MTYLWGGMILVGIIYGAFTGNLKEVSEAVVSSSGEAVSLCISMAGITAMWTGIMKIAELEERRRKTGTGGRKKGTASNEMCTFLIINVSSLQLIPVNMIAYRTQYGSVNPTAIVGPAVLATAVSTGAAVIFCRIADRKGRNP